jgi:hypothetical protein
VPSDVLKLLSLPNANYSLETLKAILLSAQKTKENYAF